MRPTRKQTAINTHINYCTAKGLYHLSIHVLFLVIFLNIPYFIIFLIANWWRFSKSRNDRLRKQFWKL